MSLLDYVSTLVKGVMTNRTAWVGEKRVPHKHTGLLSGVRDLAREVPAGRLTMDSSMFRQTRWLSSVNDEAHALAGDAQSTRRAGGHQAHGTAVQGPRAGHGGQKLYDRQRCGGNERSGCRKAGLVDGVHEEARGLGRRHRVPHAVAGQHEARGAAVERARAGNRGRGHHAVVGQQAVAERARRAQLVPLCAARDKVEADACNSSLPKVCCWAAGRHTCGTSFRQQLACDSHQPKTSLRPWAARLPAPFPDGNIAVSKECWQVSQASSAM